MGRVALDMDDLVAARGDDLAAADAAERADRCRIGSAPRFDRRNCWGAARLCQRADRYCAGGDALKELSSR